MLSIKVARTLSTDALINRHRMTAVCAKSSARVIQETNSLYRNTEFQLLKKNLKKQSNGRTTQIFCSSLHAILMVEFCKLLVIHYDQNWDKLP